MIIASSSIMPIPITSTASATGKDFFLLFSNKKDFSFFLLSQSRFSARTAAAEMSERKITQLFGLILGALFTCTLILNAFAF
jgi:hypothetical protein